ncbi:hypothetical protein [Oceanimonas baumannii]|uniref:hypothetical protein n=1 Tax=Oceanimonas baumannii TaxID=129578 RepID=UPI003A8E0511
MLVTVFLLAAVSGLSFYVAALQSALPPRRWAMLGCLFGPAVLPMFMARRRFLLLSSRGLRYALLRA